MLWTWFFEFLAKYDGDDYRRLPGLIRVNLIYSLIRETKRNAQRWQREISTDFSESSSYIHESVSYDLHLSLLGIAAKQELEQLPEKEASLLRRFYFCKETPKQIAKSMHCTERFFWMQRRKALKTLKSKIS